MRVARVESRSEEWVGGVERRAVGRPIGWLDLVVEGGDRGELGVTL